jgi:glutamate synthase (NADPH/NADH) small chain
MSVDCETVGVQETAVGDEAIDGPKPGQPSKLAWYFITRELPGKRAASERKFDFHEVYSLYDAEKVRDQAQRCIQCPTPSCRTGCPLSNRIPEWLALVADGQFLEAAAVSQETSNFPEICSRVCPQERLCEASCILNARSEPTCIGAIEQFINEYAFAHGGVKAVRVPPNGMRVAIVGAGPAGLACADQLAKSGYAPTVFEALPMGGGLLVFGIPSFKLEKWIVERRLDVLRVRGVEFRFGVRIGKDISLGQLRKEFDAVFLGIGAQQPKALDIPGAELKGVYQAIPFLVQKNVATPSDLPPIEMAGKRVAVLGGGDSAMDCLRTAVRCGAAQAMCVYRRDFANMPGSRKEFTNALEEGAEFSFLTNPIALEADPAGRVSGVRCVRMKLGDPDSSGRRKPVAVPGSEFVVPAELVLVAYGFDPVPFPAQSDLKEIAVNDWGGTIVDANQMTSVPGVFSGGDQSRGASLVVHAVRDGRKAAEGIDRYLRCMKKTGPAG